LCEQREREAPDATSRRKWTELAIEWHLLARASAEDEQSEKKPLPQGEKRAPDAVKIEKTSVDVFIERLVKALRNIGKK
jgi:hypothetical protein